jgi:hypothetical protein
MPKSIPSELKKCIEDHRLWLESHGQHGHRAVLNGFDLSDLDFQGVKLEGAHLLGADMTRIQLRAADLTGADLMGCCLEHAGLQWANLAGANMSEASIAGAHLQFTNFSRAILESAGFENARMHNTWFWRSVCTGTDFTGSPDCKSRRWQCIIIVPTIAFPTILTCSGNKPFPATSLLSIPYPCQHP